MASNRTDIQTVNFQINVDGLSKSKSDYLSLIQETHTPDMHHLQSRGTIGDIYNNKPRNLRYCNICQKGLIDNVFFLTDTIGK